ncbi:MAG: hypothetical protein JW730_18595 [Anaerolineales bacterium]|nr:hypothetical protein [Anaerolineales bacterium]
MLKTVLKYSLCLGLLIVSQACTGAMPGMPTLDPNAIDTAIAGTMAAAATQTGQAASLMEMSTPTAAPTKTLSPSPFPTYTLVASVSYVYVSKSTHCRAGPGEEYASLGALKAGEAVQVVGRSADVKYWIIRNPRNLSQLCWLSGKYASVTGIVGALPVFTSPPRPTATRTRKPPPTRTPKPPATASTPATVTTPATAITPGTPSFTASYSSTVNCLGNAWYVQIDLTNNGTVTFQSIALVMEDTVTGFVDGLISDDFINSNGCSTIPVDTLPPGTANKVSLPPLTYNPAGNLLNVGVQLCSEPAQGGSCISQALTFTP